MQISQELYLKLNELKIMVYNKLSSDRKFSDDLKQLIENESAQQILNSPVFQEAIGLLSQTGKNYVVERVIALLKKEAGQPAIL